VEFFNVFWSLSLEASIELQLDEKIVEAGQESASDLCQLQDIGFQSILQMFETPGTD
jgi:hypothetical protein